MPFVRRPGAGRATAAVALFALSLPAAAQADASFARCLAGLQGAAQAAGVTAATWREHTAALAPDRSVLERLDFQPEFRTPIWDYMAALVDAERVADGVERLAAHRDTLAAVERRFGVDAATVVAVWGVESDYGRSFGRYPLVQALATLSCEGRRQDYFRGELFATLRIVQGGHVEPAQLVGSWAGAFGHTQFMPSTYERLAIDFDGDGRRDLVASVPDALASTAHFLQKAGWRAGEPWGFEVRLPAGFDTRGEGRRTKRPLSEWAARGLRRADGSPLGGTGLAMSSPAGLLAPAGAAGPAFLVLRNFDALYSYNAAESYGLAIAHLSDRLRGGGAFVVAWPTDDPGLSRAERRELQALLIARGHDIGAVDGMLGERSRAAIRAEQQRLGREANGRAGQRLLVDLRGG
jgi:lytic murein transglycosylase